MFWKLTPEDKYIQEHTIELDSEYIEKYPERTSWEYYDTYHYIEWIYNRATELLNWLDFTL